MQTTDINQKIDSSVNTVAEVNHGNENAENEPEMVITVRKLDFPVKPRGVLAE